MGHEAVGEFVPHPGQRGDPQSPGAQTAFEEFRVVVQAIINAGKHENSFSLLT